MGEKELKEDLLRKIINQSKAIVFFGGAGVSVPSGIPDFRSSNGLYQEKQEIPPEEILSRSFFDLYPEEFYRFYKSKMIYPDAKPNPAHYTLARWEREGKLKAVITQNIDGLHQQAGNKKVLELHGSIHRNHCLRCGKSYGLDYVLQNPGVPHCDCGGIIKPDVVLYEEPLDDDIMADAVEMIRNADTLIVAGTSLLVNPAAGMVRFFQGNHFVIINKGPTAYDAYADLVIHDDIAKVLGAID
jgi:NAD-dependent deacetylase